METLPLVTVALLGAYHGLNPAMGWLFAVGLGCRIAIGVRCCAHCRRSRPATSSRSRWSSRSWSVWARWPIRALHLAAAGALIGFGVFRFARPRAHPRWTTMRVTRKELTWWSFLMSSAHGAGLMVAPVLLGAGAVESAHAHAGETHEASATTMGVADAAIAVTVHVGAMVAVMAVVALVVYEKLGLTFLRRAWVNSDQFWAGAFIVAGLVTLLS